MVARRQRRERDPRGDELITLRLQVFTDTHKAVMVGRSLHDKHHNETWLPLSLITVSESTRERAAEPDWRDIEMPRWLAERNSLVAPSSDAVLGGDDG